MANFKGSIPPTPADRAGLDFLRDLRASRNGILFPRTQDGVLTGLDVDNSTTPPTFSVPDEAPDWGSRAAPWRSVYARRYISVSRGFASLSPSGFSQRYTGIVSGNEVPGLDGTCGHVRYSVGGDFGHIDEDTLASYRGFSFGVGYELETEVPELAKVSKDRIVGSDNVGRVQRVAMGLQPLFPNRTATLTPGGLYRDGVTNTQLDYEEDKRYVFHVRIDDGEWQQIGNPAGHTFTRSRDSLDVQNSIVPFRFTYGGRRFRAWAGNRWALLDEEFPWYEKTSPYAGAGCTGAFALEGEFYNVRVRADVVGSSGQDKEIKAGYYGKTRNPQGKLTIKLPIAADDDVLTPSGAGIDFGFSRNGVRQTAANFIRQDRNVPGVEVLSRDTFTFTGEFAPGELSDFFYDPIGQNPQSIPDANVVIEQLPDTFTADRSMVVRQAQDSSNVNPLVSNPYPYAEGPLTHMAPDGTGAVSFTSTAFDADTTFGHDLVVADVPAGGVRKIQQRKWGSVTRDLATPEDGAFIGAVELGVYLGEVNPRREVSPLPFLPEPIFGYDRNYNHRVMGVCWHSIFVTQNNLVQVKPQPIGRFVSSIQLPEDDLVVGDVAFVDDLNTWIEWDGSEWLFTDIVFAGAVEFDETGAIKNLYSERTEEYNLAVNRIPPSGATAEDTSNNALFNYPVRGFRGSHVVGVGSNLGVPFLIGNKQPGDFYVGWYATTLNGIEYVYPMPPAVYGSPEHPERVQQELAGRAMPLTDGSNLFIQYVPGLPSAGGTSGNIPRGGRFVGEGTDRKFEAAGYFGLGNDHFYVLGEGINQWFFYHGALGPGKNIDDSHKDVVVHMRNSVGVHPWRRARVVNTASLRWSDGSLETILRLPFSIEASRVSEFSVSQLSTAGDLFSGLQGLPNTAAIGVLTSGSELLRSWSLDPDTASLGTTFDAYYAGGLTVTQWTSDYDFAAFRYGVTPAGPTISIGTPGGALQVAVNPLDLATSAVQLTLLIGSIANQFGLLNERQGFAINVITTALSGNPFTFFLALPQLQQKLFDDILGFDPPEQPVLDYGAAWHMFSSAGMVSPGR